MHKKRFVGIAAALALVPVLLIWLQHRRSSSGTEEVRVGVLLPLTGPVAEPGKQALNGLMLAVQQYNSQPGARMKIRLIIEDSQSDPKSGISAARKLINADGVKVVVGDLMSSVAMAVAPVAQQNRVVLFAPGASNPKFPDLGTYIFRNWASDDYDGKVMAEYLFTQLKYQRGGVLYVNNEYGLGLADAFKKRFEALGGTVPFSEGYDQGSRDFRAIVAKLRSSQGLQFAYLPGQPVENGHLLKQMREGGVRLPVCANLSVESPDFTTTVGDQGAGVIFTTPAFDPDSSGGSVGSFKASYRRTYGSPPDVVAGHAYDAGNILILALKNCNFDLSRLRDSLAAIKDFPGVTGRTTFTANGDVRKDVLVKRITSAENVEVLARFGAQ